MPNKYPLEPGSWADYEVDYEQEAKQLILASKNELTRKQDFIEIAFDEQ